MRLRIGDVLPSEGHVLPAEPRHACVIEHQPFDRRQCDDPTKVSLPEQREPQLHVGDGHAAAQHLRAAGERRLPGHAARGRQEGTTLVPADDVRVTDVLLERVGIASHGNAGHGPRGDRQRVEDQRIVAPVVDQVFQPLVPAEGRFHLEAEPPTHDRTVHPPQGVVRHIRRVRLHVADAGAFVDARELVAGAQPARRIDEPLDDLLGASHRCQPSAEFDAREPVERIHGNAERLALQIAREHDRFADVVVRLLPIAALREVEGLLERTHHVLETPAHVRVAGERTRLADPPVDLGREGHAVVPEQVAEDQRGAAVHAAPEVVAGVSHRGTRHVVGLEAHAIAVLAELARVRERQLGAVEQRRHGDRRFAAGGAFALADFARRPEAAGRAVVRERSRAVRRLLGRDGHRIGGRVGARARRCVLGDHPMPRLYRIAAEQAWIVDRPDGEVAVLVVRERELVGLARPRDRGAVLHEGRDTAGEVGELIVTLLTKIVQEEILHAGSVGHVGERLPVGCPHGIGVVPLLTGHHLGAPRLQMVERDVPVAEAQQVEVGFWPPVAREGDDPSVG